MLWGIQDALCIDLKVRKPRYVPNAGIPFDFNCKIQLDLTLDELQLTGRPTQMSF